MAKLYEQTVLLATYAAHDAEPSAPVATDVIVASNVEVTPAHAQTVTPDLRRGYYGSSPDIQYNVCQRVAFDVGFAGVGEGGHGPAWGGLIQACGMHETRVEVPEPWSASTTYDVDGLATHNERTWRSRLDNNVGNAPQAGAQWEAVDDVLPSAVYTPVTGGENVATLWLYIAGVLHKFEKSRGTWTLNFEIDPPQLRFEFTAPFAEPSDAVNPMPPENPMSLPTPLGVSSRNTPTVLLHGVGRDAGVSVPANFRLRLRNLTLDYGAKLVARDGVGAAPEVDIVERRPLGQITLDTPDVADLAVVRKAMEGQLGAFRLTHGNEAGNTVTLDMPALQLSSPSYSAVDGYWRVKTRIKPLPVAGNDEIKLSAN